MDKQTKRRLEKLDALEAAGVDNWDYYDDALQQWHKEEALEDKAYQLLGNICEILCMGVEEPAGSGAGYGFSNDVMKDAEDLLASQLIQMVKDNGGDND